MYCYRIVLWLPGLHVALHANASAFETPHWLLLAKGFNWGESNTYFSARGGMVERNDGIEILTVRVCIPERVMTGSLA